MLLPSVVPRGFSHEYRQRVGFPGRHHASGSRRARDVRRRWYTGIKVGVLSDSVDYLTTRRPPAISGPVTVLPGQSGVPATGEGTAMLEIIHDLAPGAQLFFATADGGEAGFAQVNIIALRTNGCDIIVDDVGYFDESPFQGRHHRAQAVEFRYHRRHALCFSAASKQLRQSRFRHVRQHLGRRDFADGGAAASPISESGLPTVSGNYNYNVVTSAGLCRLTSFGRTRSGRPQTIMICSS